MVPRLQFWLLALQAGLGHGAYLGHHVGPLTDTVPGVGGTVWAVDKSTIAITNFTFDGSDPGTFIYAGTLDAFGKYTKTGFPLTNQRGVVDAVPPSSPLMVLQFPEGKSLLTIDWIGVLARRKKKMIGRSLITATVKKNIPKPQKLGKLQGRSVTSGEVIALDSQSIMIKDLVYEGGQSSSHFTVGPGSRPGPYGTRLPDEEGSMAALRPYRNRTIILTLPPSVNLQSMSWLAIWDQSLGTSHGWVSLPGRLTVPPAPQALGISPQLLPSASGQQLSNEESKLNCEVLSPELGLQLRWSIAGSSIILQIVANLGSDMYMAFGVKAGKAEAGGAAAGDVVVGWINTATGKGGLDDYFLSGSTTCSDGAESCPDTTKGGEKNVEMLNSVSRDNYTMLTFRRPLAAEDRYDTSILTSHPQEVFWSVGYKLAEKRMQTKPLKNKEPILLDFGRLATWNCPTEGGSSNEVAPDQSSLRPKDDQDSQPSYNNRKTVPGKAPSRRVDYDAYDYNYQYNDGGDYNYDLGGDTLAYNKPEISAKPPKQENGFSAADIAEMKKRFEEKLAHDFPTRSDGQKTTLELIPELGQFVEPFFPKRPPPGAMPPRPPPGPATHPPPASDQDWSVPSGGCNSTENTVFYLQIGPAAAKRGNQGLGRYGQAWYVNGDVAPDLYLVRGRKYTFIVEGGMGTDQEGIIHPFYLTSDNEGGYGTKSDYEARMEEVFGGLSQDRDGLPAPNIMGRLCKWGSNRAPATYATYDDFKDDLKVNCQETGNPGILRFEPTYDMPNTMYYQSFSEKFLGGKLHLLDQCHEIRKSVSKVQVYNQPEPTTPPKRYRETTRQPSKEIYYKKATRTPIKETYYSKTTRTPSKETYYRQTTRTPGKDTYYRKPTQERAPAPPAQRKKYSPSSKSKGKKKCSQKTNSGGMPKFEHFPVKEIMKEGVAKDECEEDEFGAFGGDWGEFDDEDYTDDYKDSDSKEYGDYVQPTKKPLIFKEFFNNSPLSTRRKYKPKEKNQQADNSYNQIPDLPPPASFPNLFNNVPSAGGGFMNSDNMPKLTVKRPPSYTTRVTDPPRRQRPAPPRLDVDIVNSGNSGMYKKPVKQGYQSTSRPLYTTPRQAYNSPRSPSPQPVYTSLKPLYTTRRQTYDYYTTARPIYTSPKQSYDYHTTVRPKYTTPRYSYDYDTTMKPRYTTARPSYDYQTSARPSFTTPRQAYNYHTTKASRIQNTSPRMPSDSPYKFYTPEPIQSLDEDLLPGRLPPPDNFPSFYKGKKKEVDLVRRTDPVRTPVRKPQIPPRYTPLQTLLNPLRNMFNRVGGRRQDERLPPRRPVEQTIEDIPAPLAPPRDFPSFGEAPEMNDLPSATPPRRRRRKKRPRRPLIDNSPKYQDYQDDSPTFQELMNKRPSIFKNGGRRNDDVRSRPRSRRPMYHDQLYMPSETEETVAEPEDAPIVTYAQAPDPGLGVFNPRAILPESGFTPVMPSSGNTPSLAFSIFDDGISQGGVQSGSSMMDRMESFYGLETTGDRGNVVVDIPGKDILPYVARQSVQRRGEVARSKGQYREGDPWENLIQRNTGSSIRAMEEVERTTLETTGLNFADFHSFQTVEGQDDNLNIRRVHDIQLAPDQLDSDSPLLLSVGSSLSYGPSQPSLGSSIAVGSVGRADYIHRQMLTAPDGTSLAYGNQANYGKQHPSYIQQDVQTRLGTSGTKQLDTSKDVVYGKVSETPSAPMKQLEGMDSRMLEKLALLEESQGQVGAQAVVSDLWSIMKQNEG